MASKLGLSTETIADCRWLARQVSEGVRRETEQYTTVSTERTVLRLLGVDGVDAEEVPVPNRVVEALQACGKLGRGTAVWMGSALASGAANVSEAAAGLSDPRRAAAQSEHPRWRDAIAPHVEATLNRIRQNRSERERRIEPEPEPPRPHHLRLPLIVDQGLHRHFLARQRDPVHGARRGDDRIAAQHRAGEEPWPGTAGDRAPQCDDRQDSAARAEESALHPQPELRAGHLRQHAAHQHHVAQPRDLVVG